ncbi:hypothetical protein BDW67DRAFT_55560 [Aspergillus spinulosporus]
MDDTQLNASDPNVTHESLAPLPSQFPGSIVSSRGACEACRARKIRCDRESPCLQCRRADIECIHPANKPKEKKTRILLTPQYERKIDLLDHRLESITKLLQDLKTQFSVTDNSNDAHYEVSGSGTAPSTTNSSSTHPTPSEPVRGPVVEGESSLSAHSVFVNDFLQGFFKTDQIQQSDPEIQQTLDALLHIVSTSKQQPSAYEFIQKNARPQRHVQQKYKLPPIQKAVTLINAAKAQRLAGTGWIYEYITMQPFGDLCLEVYFSEDLSPFDFISVNAGLYSLFWDYASVTNIPQDEKEQFFAYSRLCRENLETGLANLPLHLPASANVIAALLFGAFYAIELSKSSLCWSLSSKASELCQTLGYHRAVPLDDQKPDDSRYTQFLFWTTYYIDKSLSLRLGRASTIPDWDISISLPSVSGTDKEPVLAFFALWIKTARCQGNIYEMLYSPASMSESDDVRQSKIDFLISSLHELQDETEKTKADWLNIAKERSGEDLMDFYAISDDILRLSLLTHVYRAAPRVAHASTMFSSDCIKVARATLDRHHDLMAVIHKTNDIYFAIYIHWTLLFAPFVPFIVIFCHVMETQDQADLARLEAFVDSINAAFTVSEPAARMHRLFQVLYKIAARYLELRIQSNGRESFVPAMDAQLAALGFPYAGLGATIEPLQDRSSNLREGVSTEYSQSSDTVGVGTDGTLFDQRSMNNVLWMGNGAQLEDWLYNNQEPLELLQDLGFNPRLRE